MIIEMITLTIIGILCMTIGIIIWKKQKISLIHSYHYKNVKEDDIKAYTEKNGKAIFIISLGFILTEIIDFITNTTYGWAAFAICFLIGMVIFVKSQKKYNGGIF